VICLFGKRLPMAVPGLPCDPAATPEARGLLRKIAESYGAATFSGQHGLEELEPLRAITGVLPSVVEEDLMNFSTARVERQGWPPELAAPLLECARAGHLISCCWHWIAPARLRDTARWPWWRGFYRKATDFDLPAALADRDGAEFALLLRDIDAIAVQLRKFSDAGIPLLWRPLHEAEGRWFWWGSHGPETFKELWRLLFHRLTEVHGLHHLVWVLTSEKAAWYPGDDVVDVVGVDAYPWWRGATLGRRWRRLLARFDGVKPIALTEFGGVPDLERMWRRGVRWAWFCSWRGDKGPRSERAAKVRRVYGWARTLTVR
jgi:mannan endo-1,4-beta-mannosidase